MDHEDAVAALAALAQSHRLALFRQLVRVGDVGLTAGQLAEAVGIAATGLSFHMKELERAGLVTQQRQGRYVRYRIAVTTMRELLTFLAEDCCGGRPELCGPFAGVAAPTACCPPLQVQRKAVVKMRKQRGQR